MAEKTRESGPNAVWVQSPLWDAFWLFSGIWAPIGATGLFLLARFLHGSQVTLEKPGFDISDIVMLYLPLSVLHRITTTYAVLGTPILRGEIGKNPARYLYVPLGIVALCVALSMAFAFHDLFAFMPSNHLELWGFFALAYTMVLWELWHFCAQEFGVLSIYRVRAGQTSPADKRFDRFFTVALMLGLNVLLFFCFGFESVGKVLVHGTPLSDYDGPLLKHIALGACIAAAGLTLVALAREHGHPKRSAPKAAFYLLIGGRTVVLYFFPKVLGLFFLSYAVHHWMVSVGLFGRVTVNGYRRQLGSQGAALRRLVVRVTPPLALALFWYVGFGALDKAGNPTPLPTTRAFAGVPAGERILVALGTSAFFALNYLHYYYDRCFYAFSTSAVRKTVAPLLFEPPRAPRAARLAIRTGGGHSDPHAADSRGDAV